jgi:hypothetical protein
MYESPEQRAAGPILRAIKGSTDHLDDDELYEVCAQGGERELCDLLRHGLNREIRGAFGIAQREQTIPGIISRADLVMRDRGSGMVFAVVEAKMIYATDIIDIQDRWAAWLDADVVKLRPAAAANMPSFLLTWVPYFGRVGRTLRYMKGHVDGRPRFALEETRGAIEGLLQSIGPGHRVTVRDGRGEDGDLVLDAYLTSVFAPGGPSA